MPISLAVRGGHLSAVELLLEFAANRDPSISYFDIKYPLSIMAPAVGHHPDILRALIEDCQNGRHAVPTLELMPDVVSFGKVGAVEALLDAGADIEGLCSQDGSTALHLAAREGNFDVVDVLLRHGAKVGAEDSMGRTPLHLVFCGTATGEKAAKAIALLVAGGADAAVKDADGKTPAELADEPRKAVIEPMLAKAQVESSWHQKVAVVMCRKQVGKKLSNEGLHSLLMRLAGLEEDELFQEVLGFL